MPISWDANMDRKLFLAIMKTHNISVDAPAVAALLTTETQPCTAIAVKRRLERIKDAIKDENAKNTPDATASPSVKSTPKRRGATSNDANTRGKKTKIKRSTTPGEDGVSEENAEEVKCERVKKENTSDVDDS